MTIERLFFYPPLAFARLGGSDIPLDCFYWGEDDNSACGTGKTTIMPGRTLQVSPNGEVSEKIPNQSSVIVFKDGDLFRPVCPFFELHASWVNSDKSRGEGPVTEELLAAHGGHTLQHLTWDVSVANLKPFHLCQDPDSRIQAHVTLPGAEVTPTELRGVAPDQAKIPLVPPGRWIPLGSVQLTQPNQAFPELRLRFTPPKGSFYGPTNLKQRWRGLKLDDRFLFLNKDSPWCSWWPSDDDRRATPGGQFAKDSDGSYGMVDDTCDGIISCRFSSAANTAPPDNSQPVLIAYARVVVTPPDYAPDRRHVVSLADGLKDRVDRAEVFDDQYYADADLCDSEIQELMRRTFETVGLTNLDIYNDRVNSLENPFAAITHAIPFRPHEFDAFPPLEASDAWPLPLTKLAREKHRRFHVLTALKELLRRYPNLLARYVRPPLDQNPFFDRRMPVLMRGSSGDPLELTRRQYELLTRWAARLTPEPGS
jgi:hypothetical protein